MQKTTSSIPCSIYIIHILQLMERCTLEECMIGRPIFLINLIGNRVARMEEKISQTKDSLNNLLSIYMAKISLEMNQLSNQVNSVMKTFRFVT